MDTYEGAFGVESSWLVVVVVVAHGDEIRFVKLWNVNFEAAPNNEGEVLGQEASGRAIAGMKGDERSMLIIFESPGLECEKPPLEQWQPFVLVDA